MSDSFAPRSMKRKNVKGLALTPAAPKPAAPGDKGGASQQAGGWGQGGSRADEGPEEQLEIGIEFNLDLKQEDLEIVIDIGDSSGGQAAVWTCDFSHEYVTINGDYRT